MSARSRDRDTAVDATNVAAGTLYYPTEASNLGIDMDGVDCVSINLVCSGGVTNTFESSQDGVTFVDITKAGYSQNTNTTGASSFIDATDIVDFDGINTKYFRIKSVTSDASNSVKISTRTENAAILTNLDPAVV